MLLLCLGRNFSNMGYRMVNMIQKYTKFSKKYKYLKPTAELAVILG